MKRGRSDQDEELRKIREATEIQRQRYRQQAQENQEKAKQQEALLDRKNARTNLLSPFRQYREQDGPFQLFVNNNPYTGIQEFSSVTPEQFNEQKQVYDYLKNELNKASSLRQQQHQFNLDQISNPNDPKLTTVNLRGGPNLDSEINHPKNQKGKKIGLSLGYADPRKKTLDLNRIHPEHTKAQVQKANNPLLGDTADPDPIHTLLHEPAHLNTQIQGKNDPKLPNIYTHYDFGSNADQIPGIVHADLGGYPKGQFPAEVIAFTAGDIDRDFPKMPHENLARYLQDSLRYYKEQGMMDRYPKLYDQYIKKIGQILPEGNNMPKDLIRPQSNNLSDADNYEDNSFESYHSDLSNIDRNDKLRSSIPYNRENLRNTLREMLGANNRLQNPLGQQFPQSTSQFGQQAVQRQNRFDRPQSRNRSNQREEEKQEEDQYGNPLYSKKRATGGSISSGLGSLSDYINQGYAGGGGVGLGSMGRFFGLYPMRGQSY